MTARCISTTFMLILWASLIGAIAQTPVVVPDWKIELVAQAPEIRHPSVACAAPDGRVFVAEDPMDISSAHADAAEGRILCFHPDGRRTVFAEKLHAVFGLQYLEGKVYVLHNPQFSVFIDDNGVGRDRTELIESMNPNPWALDWNDHVPANFKLAMDGYFYLAVGDKGVYGAVGRDGKRVDLHGGGILRLRPDGTALEVYATGVRNILDVALTAEDEIFTYDNTDEHDWMGRLTHMVDGGFYGYPHDFVPRRPYTLWMTHDFGGGAACGTLAYTEDALPAEYADNLLLADFGKRQVIHAKIEREEGTWKLAARDDFFPNPPDDFRPVGLAWGADGKSFYICDWQHRDTKENVTVGRLWKASYTGQTRETAKPGWYLSAALGRASSATVADLVAGLSHPSKQVRLQAQRLLSAAHRPGVQEELVRNLMTSKSQPARWHALWALDAIDDGVSARAVIVKLVDDADPSIRRQAIRQLGQRRAIEAGAILASRLKDSDASVRLQAATALGRIGQPESAPVLLAALDEPDLFTRFAVFTALNRIGKKNPSAWPAIVSGLYSERPSVREGAEFAMRETYEFALAEALEKAVENTDSSNSLETVVKTSALRLLTAMQHRPAEWKGEWGAYHPALEPPPAKTNVWPGTAIAFQAFRSALNSGDSTLRFLAVEGLRHADDRPRVSSMLRQRFEIESDDSVRLAIIAALGEFRDALFGPRLAKLFSAKTQNPAIYSAAIKAAGLISGVGLEAVLADIISNAAIPVERRILAVDAAGEFKIALTLDALKPLLADNRRLLRLAAQKAAARMGGSAALESLRALASNPSIEIRREAVAALGLTHDRDAVPDLLQSWRAKETRTNAIAALAEFKDIRALDAYLDGLGSEDPGLRAQCRSAIASLRDEALPQLESQMGALSPSVLDALRQVYQNHSRARSGPLFANIAAPRGLEEYERFAMERGGNAVRGQRLFFDETSVACIRCHAVAGHGASVGPDLTLIGAQFPRKDLIEHVLEPSKVVREGYQQWLVETRDGESYSGLIRSESGESLTLIGSDGAARTIPKNSIQSRTASDLSLMPEGLQTGLSLEQFGDLIAFLESRRTDPREARAESAPAGFEPLIGDALLSDWREAPAGTKRVDVSSSASLPKPAHWTFANGLLEHDGKGGDLWTTHEFVDFELRFEWRWPDPPQWESFPIISTNSYEVVDSAGKAVTQRVLDAGDSGVVLRGLYKAQANLFCYPVGSGESWEYRTDLSLPESVRQGVTPSEAADAPIGDWNEMGIIVRGTRMTVRLNGKEVIADAELPGLPPRGPIGLQHEHGRIQFRNLFVRNIR